MTENEKPRERGTGSLRLRGATWWLRYYHHGKLVEESARTSDEAAARKLLKKKLKAADTPLFVEPAARKVHFEDLVDLVRRDAARKGNRTAFRYGTPEKPGKIVMHLAATFGGVSALHITADDVDKYGDARIAARAQPATLNRELALLRHGFKLAVRKGLIPTAPAVAMRSEAGNERQGFIEPALFEGLLSALRDLDPLAAEVTEAAFFTLLRRGNVRNLTWSMLDLTVEAGTVVQGELRLPGTATKNKKPLALPLTGRLLALVNRRWQDRIETCKYVFHRKGRRVDRFEGRWQAATTAIGLPGLLMHDLRRSGARTLIRAGVPEDIVLKLGGWRTRSMLTRYNIVNTADLEDAQEKLNAAFTTAKTVLPLRRVS